MKKLCTFALLAGVVVFLLAPSAGAFFPFGGSPFDQFNIRFIRWEIEDMDRNGDGDVSGPDEGIDITFEGGEFGWTDEEMEILEEAFDVWENVSTSFAAFTFTLPIEDPANVGTGLDTTLLLDGINLVSIQDEDDAIIEPNVAQPGMFGMALFQSTIDDTFFTTPDGLTTVPVSGGRIIECDIIIDATAHRSAGEGLQPDFDLKSTMVHEIGHLLGLGHNPMNNLEVVGDPDDPLTLIGVESPAIAMRMADGSLVLVGVTPSMFPSVFSVDDGTGDFEGGGQDLSFDDVAGISFIYPRDSGVEEFFSIFQEARTFQRPGFASSAILGGLVTAWVDGDSDPVTPRVPIVSTMTGLYVNRNEILDRGRFELRGLPKVLESPGLGAPFTASYTLTIEPINGARIPLSPPVGFDSTHSLPGNNAWNGVDYDTIFPSEVFHRDGGFFGRDNFDAGTALMFDAARGEVVSVDTGETLRRLLGRGEPMFGEASEVCPLLVIEQAAGVTVGPTMLRNFRDGWLLQSAVGAAAVDAYYQAGPVLASFLLQHRSLLTVSVWAAVAAEWSLHNRVLSLLLVCSVLVGWRSVRRGRMRRAAVVGAGIVLLALAVGNGETEAVLKFMTAEERIATADAIVEGRVTMTESRLSGVGQVAAVVTDTVIEISDGMKGGLNVDSTVSLTIPGGTAGGVSTYSSELPTFRQGEDVILYLYFVEDYGYVVLGGIQGKVTIGTNVQTGEKFVNGGRSLVKSAKSAGNTGSAQGAVNEPSRVSLSDYKAAIRDTVKRQKRAE